MNNIGYLVVLDDSDYNPMYFTMLNDVLKLENCHIVVEKKDIKGIRKSVFNILKKRKVQAVLKEATGNLILSYYALTEKIDEYSKVYDKLYVLFFNSSFVNSRYPYQYLKLLNCNYSNIKYILFYVDVSFSPTSYHANYLEKMNLFELVYSIEEKDVINNKWIKWSTPYSKIIENGEKLENKYDIYFCGVTKGRIDLIKRYIETFEKYNISYCIDLIPTKEDIEQCKQISSKVNLGEVGVYYSYEKVLEKTLNAKCILEIVQSGQEALTLRPYEAVCYNKKLITNNKAIKNFDFYESKFMMYCSSPEEIDMKWLKNQDIKYNYNGYFSPLALFKDIENRIN